MQTLSFADALEEVLHIAKSYAREYHHGSIDAAHLLKALMHSTVGLRDLVKALGQDPHYIAEWADVRAEDLERSGSPSTAPVAAEGVNRAFEEADNIRLKLGLDEITPTCVLVAMCKPGVAFTAQQLKSFPLRERDILDLYLKDTDRKAVLGAGSGENGHAPAGAAQSQSSTAALYRYCTDKTAAARAGTLDPVFGREREVRLMTEVLARRAKPNVLLVGEPGVGKTALVDGFAQAIASGAVPERFKNALLLELEVGTLMAGAAYKGEVEDRLKSVVADAKKSGAVILFIDELHQLLDPKNPLLAGVGNTLKPELARGELTVIGATTVEEYRKIIEPEKAFARRFETVAVDEPDETTCIRMIEGLAPAYEAHHGLSLEAGAVPECVRLARRYLKDKRLPDAALDLLDRTLAAVKLGAERGPGDVQWLRESVDTLAAAGDAEEANKMREAQWIYTSAQSRMSPILLGALEDETDFATLPDFSAQTDYLQRMTAALETAAGADYSRVGKAELAAVVAAKTGIPVGKIQSGEKERILNMEDYLKRRVVGQNHALKVLSEAVLESRSGIGKQGQPIGSFFFLGPTGTGKTELAKTLAEFLFNDETAMLRFDMSEFKEEHSAALLYGAPPGYVGYEEGGLLVNQIRQKPYSVVLFDEIEKAHPSVFDIFLQIMDEGRIHDKLGKEGDFGNALVIFTSNIGSAWIAEQFSAGAIPTASQLTERLTGHFRPEFLGRITEIIPFAPITEEMALRIFDIQLKSVRAPLERMGIALRVEDDARAALVQSGFDATYGARQIGGIIRSRVRRPLSRMLVAGAVKKGDVIALRLKEGEPVLERVG